MYLTVAAPQNTRQMLMNFAMYDQEKGLPSVLGRIDFDGVTRRQIYYSTLGRMPERGAQAIEGPKYAPRAAMVAALHGEEFQSKIREIILNAYPDKRRMVFVHVPKCAGTDLVATLKRLYPHLYQHLCMPEQTPKPALFELLRQIVIGASVSDTIAISGHVPLKWYVDRNLIRFEDEVFTTIRHPRDIVYSYISFILTRFTEFQNTDRPDTRGWMAAIGLEKLETELTPAYLADLGSQLLRARGVVNTNLICSYLGTNSSESALDLMLMTDIEITDTARYSAWRLEKFGREPPRRVNPSQPLFTPEIASAANRAYIEDLIAEDIVLYEAVKAKLDAQDALSIRGRVFG